MRAIHHRPIYSRYHALAALGFLFGVVYGIFSLTLPIFAGSIFANIAVLGAIFALPELIGVFIDIPLGAFSNRFGRRRTILYSGLLLGLSALAFIAFRHPVLFVLALVLYEVATQAYIIPADAELMAISPPRRTGRFNGFVEGLHNFGFSIGPIFAGLLLTRSTGEPFWLAIGVVGVMLVITFVSLPREEHAETFRAAVDHLWRRDRVFRASFAEFVQMGFTGMYLTFLFFIFALHWGFVALMEPLYTDALGFSGQLIGLIYAGFTIPFLVVSILTGRYLDHGSAKTVSVLGLALMAASTIGFGLTVDPWWLFGWALVAGTGDALLLPAVMSVLDRLSSYQKKEHIAGVKVFAESLGYFLGPLVAGFAVAAFGFQTTFLYLGVLLSVLPLVTLTVPFRADRYEVATAG